LLKWPPSRTQRATNVGKDLGKKEFSYTVVGNVKQYGVSSKLKIVLPYDPAIPLLGIYTKECESGINKGTCTSMIFSALLIIAKLRKQPRCATTDEWTQKMWYIYTMGFYSATSKNETLSFAGKWMELENIILSEVKEVQKANSHMFSFIYGM
jgi:hypothetical protein